MKKFISALILVVVLMSVSASSEAAYNLDFTIFNDSGSTVKKIYMSPSWKDDFDRNYDLIVKSNGSPTTIRNGDNEDISFRNASQSYRDSAYWDMYVECADGRVGLWKGIRLSEVVAVRIDYNMSLQPITALDVLSMF